MSTPTKQAFCAECNRTPEQISEYIFAAEAEGITPEAYVWAEEGTLDHATGMFLCTDCYYRLGQPSGRYPHQWTATPENLTHLHLGEIAPHESPREGNVLEMSLAEFKARLAREL